MGPLTGSTLVQVLGFHFDSSHDYKCVFGGVPVPAQYASDTVLTCRSPEWFGPIVPNGFTRVPLTALDGDTPIANFTDNFLFYPPPHVLSLTPSTGNATGGTVVAVEGSAFISTSNLCCRFGEYDPVSATYVTATRLVCHSPPYALGSDPVVPVEVSLNGIDFTQDGVAFRYANVPFLGTWSWWELALLIGGSALGALVVVVAVALCLYRRARARDKTRRFLDEEDDLDRDETESLIASINSKSMRQVLAGVQRVAVDELRIDRRIGRGSFGEVFHAHWGGTEIAVKKLPKHMLASAKFLEDFAQEITIMAKLRHPNVIQFLGVATDKVSLYMLTEYMPRGSLYDVIHDPEQGTRVCAAPRASDPSIAALPLELIMSLMLDTARGMTYLHKINIVHRDLKSHNLLVDQHFVIRICDFGLSRLFEESQSTMTACGTPCWTAPEVLRNEHYTPKADVYSFAVVLWECLAREDPFAGMPPFHVVFAVGTKGARPDVLFDPSPLSQLMVRCWAEAPEERPSFLDIVHDLNAMLGSDGRELAAIN